MGDQWQYHDGAAGAQGGHGEVQGALTGSKQQDVQYLYTGGLSHSVPVQYDHCPTEQRFQVGRIQVDCRYVLKNVYLNSVEEQLINNIWYELFKETHCFVCYILI